MLNSPSSYKMQYTLSTAFKFDSDVIVSVVVFIASDVFSRIVTPNGVANEIRIATNTIVNMAFHKFLINFA